MSSANEMNAQVADELMAALDSNVPIEPVRTRISGAEQAYAVQRLMLDRWIGAGRKVVGQKIGLTSASVRTQIGVSEPDFGTLFEDMGREDGATLTLSALIRPRVEGEIAFVLKEPLRGEVTAQDVIAATGYVSPAIEICDSRIRGWDIRLEDTLADNASSGLFVIGRKRTVPSLQMLASCQLKFWCNGELVGEGQGSECMGNPANAVAWLAQAVGRFDASLNAGDVVLSGALSKMVTAEAGMTFRAEFGELGSVGVRFDR